MSLRRPTAPKTAPPVAPAFEFNLVDVMRLDCVLDNKLPISFDLNKKEGHSYKETKQWLVITLGERVIRIPMSRILYLETRPEQIKQQITSDLIIKSAAKE